MGDFVNYIEELSAELALRTKTYGNFKPTVSVIIPAYNVEKYVYDCLNSITSQTLTEIEIIFINDGSTDNTFAIAQEFAKFDSRIKIINQSNAGQAAARNRGIEVAQGKYIGFVDSDDWVDKNFFCYLYNVAEKYNSDIAVGEIFRCNNLKRRKLYKYSKEEVVADSDCKIAKAGIPALNYVMNKIYKRDSLLNTKVFFKEGMWFEDIEWLIKIIYYMGSLAVAPKAFYFYRKRPGSTVTQKSLKHKADYNFAMSQMQKFIKEHNIQILLESKNGKKEKIKIFGITILKLNYYYSNTIKISLFGFIPFAEIRKSGF